MKVMKVKMVMDLIELHNGNVALEIEDVRREILRGKYNVARQLLRKLEAHVREDIEVFRLDQDISRWEMLNE